MRFIIFFIFITTMTNSNAGSSVVTVGSDGACDYSSITAASFNEPIDGILEIRLAKNAGLNSLQILDDRDTFIRGGFDNCSDFTASGRSVIDGSSFSGAIFVVTEATNTTRTLDMALQDLEIRDGNSNTSGGAISLTGSWHLSLNNVYMHRNVSNQDGGAIFMQESSNPAVRIPSAVIFDNSIISNNSADNGGAIACDGAGEILAISMQMANNNASVNGGAVYVNDGCEFYQFGGGLFQGILLNTANGFGGGIYASNNAIVRVRGSFANAGMAAVISNNAANGGGIAVTSGASLFAYDAVINNNTASSTGGGIRSNGGHVVIERINEGARCHAEVRCSTVSNNTANGSDPSFSGGGAIATFGGTLRVTGTYIENNSAQFGSAIRARFMPLDSLTPTMTMVGNVVAGNQNAPQVVYLDESSADIAFSTFVDNEDNVRVIELAYPTTAAGPNDVSISGSIFDQNGSSVESAELTTTGQFPAGDCNRNEANSTGDLIGQPRSTTGIVLFEDRAGGDYRLSEVSLLVDYCDWSILGSDSNFSANGFPRPVNNDIGNLHGIYDLGGLERYPLDHIFSDGLD